MRICRGVDTNKIRESLFLAFTKLWHNVSRQIIILIFLFIYNILFIFVKTFKNMIYFIGNKEMNICKIGYSKRPYRRIETLRGSVPFRLDVFDIIEGSLSEEKMFHDKYHKWTVKGEWFELDKVEELGFSLNIEVIYIKDFMLIKNKDTGYYHLGTLMSSINRVRVSECMSQLNFSVWKKSNKEFIDSIDNPIIHDRCIWVSKFIMFDLIRTSCLKLKMFFYHNMDEILSVETLI